jgi:hypothetical protein
MSNDAAVRQRDDGMTITGRGAAGPWRARTRRGQSGSHPGDLTNRLDVRANCDKFPIAEPRQAQIAMPSGCSTQQVAYRSLGFRRFGRIPENLGADSAS